MGVRGCGRAANEAAAVALAARTMAGRNGTAGDFCGVAVFLASPAARYVTGQAIFVDGGFSSTWAPMRALNRLGGPGPLGCAFGLRTKNRHAVANRAPSIVALLLIVPRNPELESHEATVPTVEDFVGPALRPREAWPRDGHGGARPQAHPEGSA